MCIDIDGTLVGSSGVVPQDVWNAAAEARAHGVRIAICTGRPALGVALSYATRLDKLGWHSFQNGSSIVQPSTGVSRSTYLAPDTVAAIIALAREHPYALELYTDTAYAIENTSRRAHQHADLLGVPFAPSAFESLQGPIVRAQWMGDRGEVDAMLALPSFGLEVATSTSPVMPDTMFISMTAPGITKAVAVRAIAGEYSIPLAEVMFVGDGGNDIAAMRVVGTAVAMANAEPDVRAAAHRVVGDVDQGGLQTALEWAISR